jgi:hypothetical protein
MTRQFCEFCSWSGDKDEVLRAPSPFDEEELLLGCPYCKGCNTMRRACDVEGCPEVATCGGPTRYGYRMTCWKHQPSEHNAWHDTFDEFCEDLLEQYKACCKVGDWKLSKHPGGLRVIRCTDHSMSTMWVETILEGAWEDARIHDNTGWVQFMYKSVLEAKDALVPKGS